MGSPANMMKAAALGRQRAATMIGRFQAPELFFSGTQDFTTPSTLLVPRTLNLTRPLDSITIELQFRLTVTVGAYAAVSPEAPQNILQKILLNGTHRAFGAITPINISGATQFAWPTLFQTRGNDALISVGGGALNRVAEPGRAIASGFTGAVATHDMVVIYNVPLGPQFGTGQAAKRNSAGFLYMPQDWADSLSLQLQFGDKSAMGDPTGATVAFTSFGSAAGLPLVRIHLNYSILGQAANSISAGVTLRQENSLSTFVTAGLQQRLTALQKRITTHLMVKSGINQTAGLTAGVQTFASLSDQQLDRTQIQVDNKPVRNNQSNFVAKAYYERMYDSVIPSGYFLLSFLDAQNPLLAYRGDQLSGGSTFEIISDVLTASANNRQQYVQEQVIGGDFGG